MVEMSDRKFRCICGLLSLSSALTGGALCALCCIGLAQKSPDGSPNSDFFSTQNAIIRCLCILGILLGAMLCLAESGLSIFLNLFGFLRYHVGKALTFALCGVLTASLGRSLRMQCDCRRYDPLLGEGIACVAVACAQVIAILSCSSPASRRPSTTRRRETEEEEEERVLHRIKQRERRHTKSYVPQDIVEEGPPASKQDTVRHETTTEAESTPPTSDMPTWMQV